MLHKALEKVVKGGLISRNPAAHANKVLRAKPSHRSVGLAE